MNSRGACSSVLGHQGFKAYQNLTSRSRRIPEYLSRWMSMIHSTPPHEMSQWASFLNAEKSLFREIKIESLTCQLVSLQSVSPPLPELECEFDNGPPPPPPLRQEPCSNTFTSIHHHHHHPS